MILQVHGIGQKISGEVYLLTRGYNFVFIGGFLTKAYKHSFLLYDLITFFTFK